MTPSAPLYIHRIPVYLAAQRDDLTIPAPPQPWAVPKPRRWWPWWLLGAMGLIAPGVTWAVLGMGAR